MSAWILIVSWAVAAPYDAGVYTTSMVMKHAIAMQEFGGVEACQFASLEAQKIAPGIRVVCVPKGSK